MAKASISFDPSEILPMLQKVGLGQTPSVDRPPVDAMPAPPMPPAPPPPIPAQAGFNLWASDPRTQKKIADGVTLPGQPLVPPAAAAQFSGVQPLAGTPATPPAASGGAPAAPGMAPAAPGMAPAAPAAPISQDADMAAHPDAYQRNSLVGRGWGRTLAIGGVGALQSLASGLNKGGNPTAGMSFVNQQLEHDAGVPAANAAIFQGRVIQPLKDAAALADTASQTAQRNAAANKSDTAADATAPFVMTKEQAAAIAHPELAGTQTTTRDYTRALTAAGNNAASVTAGAGHDAARVTVGAGNNAASTANNAANNATRETVQQMADKTKALIAGGHDATSRANNANSVANRGTVGGAAAGGAVGFKVPADVTRRAALASNVNENADGAEQILARRPDIVGAMGGRFTNVQQMIGSDDQDIQALGVRMHNIALASNGAHGVRSAPAVQKTEDELFNNFKAGPKGIAGALGATRSSMQTFLNDEKSFQTTGSRAGGTAATAEGTRKKNAAGDPVVFHNGQWGPG